MDALKIIDEIKHLPPEEQARVVNFVRTLDDEQPWTGQKLSEAAAMLVLEKDPIKSELLKERIEAGFYGKAHNA